MLLIDIWNVINYFLYRVIPLKRSTLKKEEEEEEEEQTIRGRHCFTLQSVSIEHKPVFYDSEKGLS